MEPYPRKRKFVNRRRKLATPNLVEKKYPD